MYNFRRPFVSESSGQNEFKFHSVWKQSEIRLNHTIRLRYSEYSYPINHIPNKILLFRAICKQIERNFIIVVIAQVIFLLYNFFK